MKTKSMKNIKRIIVIGSLTLLFCFSIPLFAGSSKHKRKAHITTTQTIEKLQSDESKEINLPAPVADDSPINPALIKKNTKSHRPKKSSNVKKPKKKQKRRSMH